MGTILNPWLYDKIKDKKINESGIPSIISTDINNFSAIISQVNSIGWYNIKVPSTNFSVLLYFDKTPFPTYYGALIKLHGDIFSPDCCTSNPVSTLQCTGATSHITGYCVEVGRYNQTNGSYVDETIPDAVLYNMVNSLPTQTNSTWLIGGILAGIRSSLLTNKRKEIYMTEEKINFMIDALQAAKEFLEVQAIAMYEIGEWDSVGYNVVIKKINKALCEI